MEFDIVFNKGINQIGELLDMGVEKGILRRSGTWISYGDVRLGQGRERAREFLEQNPTVCQELKNEILRAYGAIPEVGEAEPGDAEAEHAGEPVKKGSDPADAALARSKPAKKSSRK